MPLRSHRAGMGERDRKRELLSSAAPGEERSPRGSAPLACHAGAVPSPAGPARSRSPPPQTPGEERSARGSAPPRVPAGAVPSPAGPARPRSPPSPSEALAGAAALVPLLFGRLPTSFCVPGGPPAAWSARQAGHPGAWWCGAGPSGQRTSSSHRQSTFSTGASGTLHHLSPAERQPESSTAFIIAVNRRRHPELCNH